MSSSAVSMAQAFSSANLPLPASTGNPTTVFLDGPDARTSHDAANASVTFVESPSSASVTRITGFGSDDRLQISLAQAEYTFDSVGSDLIISGSRDGVTSSITLVGAIAIGTRVIDEASAEAAVGADFFSYSGPGEDLRGTQMLSAVELGSSFADRAQEANVTTITSFGADDRITVDLPEKYSFFNDRGNLVISFQNGAITNRIVLAGAVDANAAIFDEASAEAAIGSDFFRPFPAPINMPPVITVLSSGIVAENLSTTTVAFQVAAIDAPGQSVTFSIAGRDAALLNLNATTGDVTFRTSPDFEALPEKTQFEFTITATDSAGLASDPLRSFIFLTNVNEAPTFATSTRATSVSSTLAAGALVIAPASVIDPDANQNLQYSLSGPDAALFRVNPLTGAVSIAPSPEMRIKSTYGFDLIATDNGSPSLSASQTITVSFVGTVPDQSTSTPFFLLVPGGASAIAQGTGTVFGTREATQEVVVLDGTGAITFDGSFNAGGDRIVLTGAASTYTALRSGGTVQIRDSDTVIQVPVGTGGTDIVFGDGVRSLALDTQTGAVRIGGQPLTTSAAAIIAPAGAATATGITSASVGGQLLINAGQSATAIGKLSVFGTIGGQETVTVATGAQLSFDGSFNAGGDTVNLAGARAAWSASRSGGTALLSGPGGENVAVPVGSTGMTVRFADGDRTLVFDAQAGVVKLGGLVLTSTPAFVLDAQLAGDALGMVV